MQNAKDTFYEALRTRLATVNPDRTIVVRGVTRPAVIVEENELVSGDIALDCFRLRWTAEAIDTKSAMPLVTMTCEIAYTTAGTAINTGMDRGRTLSAMDAELAAMINTCPQRIAKTNYAGLAFGNSAVTMSTNIWWGDAAFGPCKVVKERMERTATIAVMSYRETGEV